MGTQVERTIHVRDLNEGHRQEEDEALKGFKEWEEERRLARPLEMKDYDEARDRELVMEQEVQDEIMDIFNS
jgi:hypothetical protein